MQDVSNKTNYRLITLLPIISKIFEKVLRSQLETVANKIFSSKLWIQKKAFFREYFLKLIKELAKMFRYKCSRRSGNDGP